MPVYGGTKNDNSNKLSMLEKGKEATKIKSLSQTYILIICLFIASCASQRDISNYPTKLRTDVITALNDYRVSNNLPKITSNAELDDFAKRRAQHAWEFRKAKLSDGHSYFTQDVSDSRISGLWFGENLYSGPNDVSGASIVAAWDQSYTHKLLMNRKTLYYCSAAEAFDNDMIVVALICNDLQDKSLIRY